MADIKETPAERRERMYQQARKEDAARKAAEERSKSTKRPDPKETADPTPEPTPRRTNCSPFEKAVNPDCRIPDNVSSRSQYEHEKAAGGAMTDSYESWKALG